MIGVAREDCDGAINLFREQNAHKLVRERRGAESENEIGVLADLLGKAVGTPN